MEVFINLLNRLLNLQFVGTGTTKAETPTAGPTSPATVTPEATSEATTTGTGTGTIFLHISLWNHDLFLHRIILPKIDLMNMCIIVTGSCAQCWMCVWIVQSWFWLLLCFLYGKLKTVVINRLNSDSHRLLSKTCLGLPLYDIYLEDKHRFVEFGLYRLDCYRSKKRSMYDLVFFCAIFLLNACWYLNSVFFTIEFVLLRFVVIQNVGCDRKYTRKKDSLIKGTTGIKQHIPNTNIRNYLCRHLLHERLRWILL